MKTLQKNDVIRPVGEHALLDGLSRILHINRAADLAVVISIDYARISAKACDRTTRKRRGAKKGRQAAREQQGGADRQCNIEGDNPRYYWRSPKNRSLSALEGALNDDRIVKTAIDLPMLVTMKDVDIQKRYPPRMRNANARPIKRKDGRLQQPRRLPRRLPDGTPMSATLDIREQRLEAIKPIIDRIREVGSSIFETGEVPALVKNRSDEGFRKNFVLDALNRYLALGCGDNALLGGLDKCGGSGFRVQTKRIGRPLGLFKMGKIDQPGKFLTEDDKAKIRTGWHTYVEIEKHSRRDAWMLFLGAFYAAGTKLHHGVETPTLLPVHERPSYSQFCYWGPRGEGNKSAFEVFLKPQEWEQKFRALTGTVTGTIPGVGHTGYMDSTRTNSVLVSMMNRLNALGTGHRLLIHDAFSDVVTTPYVGLEAPSEYVSLLAICCGATPVAPMAGRLGLELGEDQIPAIFWLKYIADNSELRTRGAMAILKQCGSSIEYVEVNRAERKGPVESGHHKINAHLDDAIDGSNHGRQTERGEEAAAISACWTFADYFAELLLAIAYHNNDADASALLDTHPCRTEMARAGVPRTRMGIYRWAIAQGNRNCSPPSDLRVLRARLLPTFRGRVFANGIRVLRPDRGNKCEYIAGLRYMGPRIEQARMRERARRGEQIYLDLKLDPYAPNCAWFSDDKGFHDLLNACSDPIMQSEATLADYLVQQDDEHLQELLGQTDKDQAALDYTNHRATRNLEHRTAKKEAIQQAKEAGKKVTRKSLKTGIRAYRAAEAALIKRQLDQLNSSRLPAANSSGDGWPGEPQENPASTQTARDSPPLPITPQQSAHAQDAVRRFRQQRKAA